MSRTRRRGQSMVEYALAIGCVSALCMVALGSLGFINWRIFHNMEHAFSPGPPTSAHPTRTIKQGATPWVLE